MIVLHFQHSALIHLTARNPNGSSTWVILTPPTKGVSNGTGGGETQPLVMNEFFSRGADPDFDWIEIYNPNACAS